jgi:hypothetical protein
MLAACATSSTLGTWIPTRIARGTDGLVSMIEKVARIAQKWGLRKTPPASSVGQDARPGDRVQADMGRRCMVVARARSTLWHSIRADNGPVL